MPRLIRSDRPHPRTPALERLLARVRGRLLLAAGLYGAGMVLLALAAIVLFAFLADWALSVPRAVRLWHALLILAVPVIVLWHAWWRQVRRVPDASGLALLAERADPDAHELLVSAVAFQERPEADSNDALRAALVERVLARADQRASRLDVRSLFDLRSPIKRLAAGVLACLALGTVFAANPEHAGVFLDRLTGASTPWPDATELAIEVPLADGSVRVEPLGERGVAVEAARGSDVPVLVRARGQAPREVVLDFGDGRRVAVSRQGGGEGRGGVYRTVLRGVQEDLELVARGGDDSSGRARLHLTVLQPPEILGLALGITPPAYTGLQPEWVWDRGARVVAGSRLAVHLRTDPVDVTGRVRLLPDETVVELEPLPFPGADALEGLGFEFTADQSVRLRFEILDARGLANPDPGLFAIDVVPDRAPEVEQVAPTRSDVETSARGAVALRVRAEDDFGLTRFAWRAREAASETWTTGADLPLVAPGADAGGAAGTVRSSSASLRLDVPDLLGTTDAEGSPRASTGTQILIEAFALDNATPPREGKSAGVRVRILGDDELLRRIQERLGRARAQASALATLQAERRTRVADLVDALADDGTDRDEARQITSALNGQRRAAADAEALVRELTSVVELALYARLDDKAAPLLTRLDELLVAAPSRSFQAEPWRELVAWQSATGAGAGGFASHLVGLAALGLAVHEEGAAAATRALERALSAGDPAVRHAELEAAHAAQGVTLARLEDLLARLSEWDDFHSVLAQTREMLDRQRGVRERTRRFAQDR